VNPAWTVTQTLGLSSEDHPVSGSADVVAAFQRVCETQFSAVCAYIRYRVSNADAAEELTAKTFLKALEGLETFDPEKGELTAWVFGIARHLITDHVRARRRWRWIPIDWLLQPASREPNPELAVAALEQQRHLAAALACLPDRDRDLLGLKFVAGLTNREIARMTGLKESHVGVIVYRAVGRLRQLLAGTGARHG
jgi:RNA polymerase sigma-70 factor (ECF subfamily)